MSYRHTVRWRNHRGANAITMEAGTPERARIEALQTAYEFGYREPGPIRRIWNKFLGYYAYDGPSGGWTE